MWWNRHVTSNKCTTCWHTDTPIDQSWLRVTSKMNECSLSLCETDRYSRTASHGLVLALNWLDSDCAGRAPCRSTDDRIQTANRWLDDDRSSHNGTARCVAGLDICWRQDQFDLCGVLWCCIDWPREIHNVHSTWQKQSCMNIVTNVHYPRSVCIFHLKITRRTPPYAMKHNNISD
jgi:hypothetical protein